MKIIFLGAPGSGKGSLSSLLVSKYNFEHISTGNLFRKTIASDSPLANQLKQRIMSGQLVEDDLTNNVVKNEALRLSSQKNVNIVFDGYPRNISQAQFLNKLTNIDYVIDVQVDEKELIKRISGRRLCPTCKTIYNIYYKAPKVDEICDIDNTILIQRNDDQPEIFLNRLVQYHEVNDPVVEYYKKLGNCHQIQNDDLETAFKQLLEICKIK